MTIPAWPVGMEVTVILHLTSHLKWTQVTETDQPWTVLLDPATYLFYNTTMSRNHEPYRNLPGQYSTDLVAAAALGFLDDAIAAKDRPFFLGIAPIAPHSETIITTTPVTFNPPVPAKRHEHLFPNVTVPRTPAFNPDTVRPQAQATVNILVFAC